MSFSSIEAVGLEAPPDLVIFDCDGVLVDSEIVAIGVLAECLNEAGVMLNVEQTMAYGVGKGAAAVAAAIKTDFGITLPANFFEDMGSRIIAAYAGKLRPMDGILELLAALKLRRYRPSTTGPHDDGADAVFGTPPL
jgi:beta-phosphoglucomutase-like phosphatase (HAD superfamily)